MTDLSTGMSRLSPAFQRLVHGTGANLLGKIWIMIAQLVAVPVLSKAWGVDGFGVWLMISTIPTYLALSDFGLGVAAGVDLTASMEREDTGAAVTAFQTVWSFLTLVTVAIGLICVAGAFGWAALSDQGTQGPFGRDEIAWSIAFIVMAALLSMQMSIRKIVFQATHKYALGTAVFDALYFAGSLAVLIGVFLGFGLIEAAMTQCFARLISLVLFSRLQVKREPWSRVGWKHAEKATLKRLFSPSLSALTLTIANSFGLQGVVLTIGWVFGPAAAAIFATTRMLTRIPMQFSGLLTRASLPELTRSQVAEDHALTARLMKLNMGLTLGVMIPAALALFLIGPTVISAMSHGEIVQSRLAFGLLGLAAAFCAVWTTLGTRLIAVNRQSEFAFLALGLYLACALMPYVSPNTIVPVLVALVVADAAIALKVLWVK